MTEILDIVNEHDEVVGQIDRHSPDKENYLVRCIFVGFYTADKHVILQRRGPLKKNAGKLTCTVSGHVESGASYEETVVKETLEEAGVQIDLSRAVHLGVFLDPNVKVMRSVFAYPFSGAADDLTVEADEGDGFVSLPVATLRQQLTTNPELFTPFLHSTAGEQLLSYIESV